MNPYLQAFVDYMEEKGVRYIPAEDNCVEIRYNLQHGGSISIHAIFDKDGDGKVTLFATNLGRFPEDRLIAGLATCNSLNAHFRWVKFYLDKDFDCCAHCDAIVDLDTAGAECFELLQRMVSILDDAYPELMRALYA